MYCKECGKEIANDSKFCNHCGTRQDSSINEKKEPKKIILEVPEVVFNNKLSKGTKLFIVSYIIYLSVIIFICLCEYRLTRAELNFAILFAALPILVVLIKYIYKLIKSK